jgi:CBS-domain-containing membrane protein
MRGNGAGAMETALRLAAQGFSVGQISEMMNMPIPMIITDIETVIRNSAVDHDIQRAIELDHLDMLRAALSPAAQDGDTSAARVLLKIHECRVSLLGLVDQEAKLEGVDDLERIRETRTARRSASS